MNFIDFVNKQKTMNLFLESASKDNKLDKIVGLIHNILKKHIGSKFVALPGYVYIKSGKDSLISKQFICFNEKDENDYVVTLNWKRDMTTNNVYSIDIYDNPNIIWSGKEKSNISLYTLGSSVVYFLPMIWTIINGSKFDLSKEEAIKVGRSIFKEKGMKEAFEYCVGNLRYSIYEGYSDSVIEDAFRLSVNEAINPELDAFRKEIMHKKGDMYKRHTADRKNQQARDEFNEMNIEYAELKDAIESGEVKNFDELRVAMKHNVMIMEELNAKLGKQEEELKKEKEDPQVTFKKMHHYVKMVIKGINNSVILCGAPGVGKTYNVKKLLKANGYNENANLCTIKGKCSPRQLYLTLYNFSRKGDIVLIDDADALVGPKAPEDSINILKAALDSTSDDDGRLVTYGVSGKLLDDEGIQIPKRFYYNGGIIVITNWNAGNLDTALRGRSFIQDINFTINDTLEIIKRLMPGIDPEHLSIESKLKAYDHLVDLADAGSNMEISIRTFGICAKIFESSKNDPDFSEEEARSMINEQMELQAARRGRKY